MAPSDSDPNQLFGAVFGFTENIDTGPEQKYSVRPVRKPTNKVEPAHAIAGKQALGDRSGATIRKRRRENHQRGLPKELLVTEKHLKSVQSLHDLLRSFHDPFAAGSELQKHIAELPVLAGRLIRTARIMTGQKDLSDVMTALSLLGNKVLEQEILLFLEDMTEIKTDLEETKQRK